MIKTVKILLMTVSMLVMMIGGASAKLIYQGITKKATGPYSKEVELLWTGEDCGSFGKVIVLGVPLILIAVIYAIF